MFCFLYCFTVTIVLLLLDGLGDLFWWSALLNSLRYWLFLPLPLFLLEFLLTPRLTSFIWLGGLSVYWAWCYTPLGYGDAQSLGCKPNIYGEPALAKQLKLMSFNVLGSNQRLSKLSLLLDSVQPNLVCLQEVTPIQARFFSQRFTYQTDSGRSPQNASPDVACYASSPLQLLDRRRLAGGVFQLVSVQTATEPIYIANLHTTSVPLSDLLSEDRLYVASTYQAQQALLEELWAVLAANEVPLRQLIVLGDFNSTEGNALYRALEEHGLYDGLRLQRVVWPFGDFTFPRNLNAIREEHNRLLPLVRLDYIFVGERYCVRNYETGSQETGSDHRPVIANLRFD